MSVIHDEEVDCTRDSAELSDSFFLIGNKPPVEEGGGLERWTRSENGGSSRTFGDVCALCALRGGCILKKTLSLQCGAQKIFLFIYFTPQCPACHLKYLNRKTRFAEFPECMVKGDCHTHANTYHALCGWRVRQHIQHCCVFSDLTACVHTNASSIQHPPTG